jgi:hypothetical protein
MINRFKVVALDDASAGMVLGAEVRDPQGNVLLAAGSQLTEALMRALQRRGVESVRIEDRSATPQELAAERERVRQRLAQLFRKPHPGAADALLREQLVAYRMEALQ